MFRVCSEPIDRDFLCQSMNRPESGALVVFEGWVRNHNEGHPVASLEYEVYKEMAAREAEKILNETKENFGITGITCVHREGHLKVGELAVWIGVTAHHRGEAFKGCQYAIDEIKTRLPIWKKEYYVEKPAEWVNCQGCYSQSRTHISEKEYYGKQTKIREIGIEGQKKLTNSHVLVIGAGGLGCPALSYLVGAGIGHLTICDSDTLEISNLHRQTLYRTEDLGQLKASIAKKSLKSLNPFIHINAFTERVTADNVLSLVEKCDVVLDCSDNFETKFLVHDACYLREKPLVQASVYQFEGQLNVYFSGNAQGCMRCTWPKIPDPSCVGNCTDVGVLGAVPGFFGTLQALEAVKIILGLAQGTTENFSLFVDLLSLEQYRIKQYKNPDCPLCGENGSIKNIAPNNYKEDPVRLPFEIPLAGMQCETIFDDYDLIDIRSGYERNIDDTTERKMTHVEQEDCASHDFDEAKNYLLVCESGMRSRLLAQSLRETGKNNIFSLMGGVIALKKTINRTPHA